MQIDNLHLKKYILKWEIRCLLLATMLLPFHVIHKNITLTFFSMGDKLSIYPILIGLLLWIYQFYAMRKLITINRMAYFILIVFFAQIISGLYGLLIFPLGDNVSLNQFDKLSKIIGFLSYKGIEINTLISIKLWLYSKTIFKSFFSLICTYGCSVWIVSLIARYQYKVIQVFVKGIIGSAILCSIYSVIEYLHLFGVHWATIALYNINPLLYDVASAHNWWPPLFGGNRIRSLFAEPSYLTIYLAVAIPFCFYYSIVLKKFNFLWKLLPTFLLIMMLTTNSKTGMGILLAEFLATIFFVIIGRKYAVYKSNMQRSLKFIAWILITVCIGVSTNNVLQHRYNVNYKILDIDDNHIITLNVKNVGRIPWNRQDDYQLTAAWYNNQWKEYGRKNISIKETLHFGESETLIVDLPKVPQNLDYPNIVIELC